jgi:hypothetical protein
VNPKNKKISIIKVTKAVKNAFSHLFSLKNAKKAAGPLRNDIRSSST